MSKPLLTTTRSEELKQQILKAGTVRFATGSFSQELYSNGATSNIEHKVQEIVEIGINELMHLITAQNNATYEAVMEAMDGLEVDREATEKHIRSKLTDEDKVDQRILDMNIEADDRHDTLDDVRQSIAKIFGK